MAIHIASLRPSQLEVLEQKLTDPNYAEQFAKALHDYLRRVVPDDGADSDRLYMTAVKLSDANVWPHLSETTLTAVFEGVPISVVQTFVQGMPQKVVLPLAMGMVVRDGVVTSPSLVSSPPVNVALENAWRELGMNKLAIIGTSDFLGAGILPTGRAYDPGRRFEPSIMPIIPAGRGPISASPPEEPLLSVLFSPATHS